MLLRIFNLFIIFGCSGSLLLRMQPSHCGGFSCYRAQALGARAPVVAARGSVAVVHRLSCLLHGMWDFWTRNRTHLKSLLQHHSSKASILLSSAFFIVQLSHPYTTTEKTIALTRQTFVDKVMSLLFNMLSRLVIAFLPRSKRRLIS